MSTKRAKISLKNEATDASEQCCEWLDCTDPGSHRAPRSPQELRAYRYFCLEHIRLYNRAWNFYAGMSDGEIEAEIRRDTVWERPTWPLGGAGPTGRGHRLMPDDLIDNFGVFTEHTRPATPPPPPPLPLPQQDAMAVLDLQPPLTVAAVKSRYKQLVKRHHPDANGGDKAAEERFKEITQAYEIIMDTFAS
jgi:DnaJ-domain-containing protein 1